jgi:hypothetical protein
MFISENILDVVARWELCTFNPMCFNKYTRLGLPWSYENRSLITQDNITSAQNTAYSHGISKDMLVVSGLLQAEN